MSGMAPFSNITELPRDTTDLWQVKKPVLEEISIVIVAPRCKYESIY